MQALIDMLRLEIILKVHKFYLSKQGPHFHFHILKMVPIIFDVIDEKKWY